MPSDCSTITHPACWCSDFQVLARVAAVYGSQPPHLLDYTACFAPAIEAVLREEQATLAQLPALQRYSVSAGLRLWLWFDQQCGKFADQVVSARGLLVVGTSLQVSISMLHRSA